MNIIFPIDTNMHGQAVQDLQDTLRQLDFDHQGQPGIYDSETFSAVEQFQRQFDLRPTGLVDRATAVAINQRLSALPVSQYLVRGKVLNPDGSPIVSAMVLAFEKQLRRESGLGRDFTNRTDGSFEISYNVPATFPFSIIVRVFSDRSQSEELVVSDVICDAKPIEELTLVVGDEPLVGPTEFQQWIETLTPILAADNLLAADLNEKDIEFLLCRHDWDKTQFNLFVLAARYNREHDFPAEWLYGLFRQELTTSLRRLVGQPVEQLKEALQNSISENIIRTLSEEQIDAVIDRLQNLLIRFATEEPEPDKPTFATLFDVANVDRSTGRTILERYVKRRGTVAEFWQELEADSSIDNDDITELKFTVQLSSVALNHVPLVNRLAQERRANNSEHSLKFLSRFNQVGWKSLLSETNDAGNSIGAPEFFGQEKDERTDRYATFLSRMVESLHPTAVLSARLLETDPSDSNNGYNFQPALDFIAANDEFDFKQTTLKKYLAERTDIDVSEETRETLNAMQRIFEVSPDYEKYQAMSLVMADGLLSANAIRRMGPTQFMRRYAEPLGRERASDMYTRAARKADTTLLLASQSASFNPIFPGIMFENFGRGLPDLEDLFGSLDLCACKHCNSVYSPAAYLVDILHYLDQRPATGNRTALDVLFERRPDLGEIELNCDNTNTMLPYVDLVLEIMETLVANDGTLAVTNEPLDIDLAFPHQTTESTEVLAANPEHLNVAAYNRVRNGVYPFTLPFDLWHEEAETYCDHLGVHLGNLFAQYLESTDEHGAYLIAAAKLGLSSLEGRIITATSQHELFELWGFNSNAAFNGFVGGTSVEGFLRQSGLTYDELIDLLKVPYVDQQNDLSLEFSGTQCQLDEASIRNLDVPAMGRMHRFIRLWKSQDLSIPELGAVLHNLRQRDNLDRLNEQRISRLQQFFQLQTTTKAKSSILINWLADSLRTEDWLNLPSLYHQVFLNATVHKPSLDVFQLNPSGTQLSSTSSNLVDHLPILYSALHISEEYLLLLTESYLPDPGLYIQNLHRLYQVSSFCKHLKITVTEFLTLIQLANNDPFVGEAVGPRIEVLSAFAETVQKIRQLPFSIPELDGLLRHQPGVGFVLDESVIADVLLVLRVSLYQLAVDHQLPDNDVEETAYLEFTTLRLNSAFTPEIANNLMGMILGESTLDQNAQNDFLTEHLGELIDPDLIINDWFENADVTPLDRSRTLMTALHLPLLEQAQQRFLLEYFAEQFSLDAVVIETLLAQLTVPASVNLLASVFQGAPFVPEVSEEPIDFEATTNSIALPASFDAYRLLSKLSFLINSLQLPPTHIEYLLVEGVTAGWPNWNQLPVNFVTEPVVSLSDFLAFTQLIQDSADRFDNTESLFELLVLLNNSEIDRMAFLERVAEATGWNIADIDYLTGNSAWNLLYPNDFRNGFFLQRLAPPCEQAKQVVISSQVLSQLVNNPINAATASAFKQAARAKYEDENAWLTVAGPLRDQIREKQRAALLTYLMEELNLESSTELYNEILVDPEMNPCMKTSRIVLAHSSVQLFVQRCLLNLESAVSLSPEDAKEWEWMKLYRVWEANRKVFLYPENWIEPELRDDKTSLYENLESGLLQGELNDATIEREYLKYLNGLNDIARLEIHAAYREWEVDKDILHVFGRTYNTPHIYYYRRWVNQDYWTPWERVELDIEGDHLLPVVWNRRLYLFWPMFLKKAEEALPETDDAELPKKYYEIRMQWSEYRDGNWLPKKISEQYLKTNIQKHEQFKEKKDYTFYQQFDNKNNLYLVSTEAVNPEAFYFKWNSCNGSLELADSGILIKLKRSFDGTDFFYNNLFQKNDRNLFKARTRISETIKLGETHGIGYEYIDASTVESEIVLRKTPGRFKLTLTNDLAHFNSRHPFFFFDDSNSFLINPRGAYVGGFSDPDLGLAFDIQTTHVPLELPDATTLMVSELAGNRFTAPSDPNPPLETEERPVAAPMALIQSVNIMLSPAIWQATHFKFHLHQHPFVCLLIEELNRYGIDGILKPDSEKEQDPERNIIVKSLKRQRRTKSILPFRYDPTDVVNKPYPKINFDFDYSGAYSTYNWELFFHAPLMLAKRLSSNQQFADAHRWFHYIFDPTYRPTPDELFDWPERVWQIKPFFEAGVGKHIQRTMLLLKSSGLSDEEKAERAMLNKQIEAWRKEPFNPHLIARMRPEAYMKATVMAYIDNLFAWGDYLFAQDSIESINEATQLYLVAQEILGDRPKEISALEEAVSTINGQEIRTFNDLRGRLDSFSNALNDLEIEIEPDNTPGHSGGMSGMVGGSISFANPNGSDGNGFDPDLPIATTAPPQEPGISPVGPESITADPIPPMMVLGPSLFFCVPKNDQLLEYWNTVEDRLFKIRHCMNIEGITRQLSLFQPAIDPGALVKAAAAGLSIGDVLADLQAPLPHYRFNTMLQKANEILSDVKSFGGALLSALEKKDAEELSILRTTHEVSLNTSLRQIKEKAIDEAKENIKSLKSSKELPNFRKSHYETLIDRGLIAKEDNQLEKLEKANVTDRTSQSLHMVKSVLAAIPNFDIGISGVTGTPVTKAWFGGVNLSFAADTGIHVSNLIGSERRYDANKASITAGHERREEDWILQKDLAVKELSQIEKQIESAGIREDIAKKDLESHDLQIKNSQEVEAYLKSKYTGPELYQWMLSQINNLYYQSYQMAYKLAKQAERTYQHELGIKAEDSNFIQFGHWDSMKKGLMAGEKLQMDLRKLELAYLEDNKRELELTKHISIRQLNPLALLQLKTTGQCVIQIPEWLFDMDCPGHYMRRIRSVALSIPSVVGPNTSINCTLSLQKSSVRTSALLSGGEYGRQEEDNRFKDYFGAIQSVVTSSGQNDSGLFETNMRHERYLPFEYSGAISTWQLKLPVEIPQFDYETITDVIIHLRYTARQGGGLLGNGAAAFIQEAVFGPTGDTNLAQLYSLKHDFAHAWHQFKTSDNPENLTVEINREHFPYFTQGRTIDITNATIWPTGATAPDNNLDVNETMVDTIFISIPANSVGEHDNVFFVLNYKLI
nr:neuraminidase-like domain-containing protein [uncultured Desulfobacter sp.]